MTRKGTQRTEAQSYLEFAEAMDLFLQWSPSTPMPFPRATTELYALDSYQNLLFSIARFKEFVLCLKRRAKPTLELNRSRQKGYGPLSL